MNTTIKVIIVILSLAFIYLLFCITNENRDNLGRVECVDSVYIFVRCEPTQDYEHLGYLLVKEFGKSPAKDRDLKEMVARIKTMMPNPEGIIFNSFDLDTAEIIRFKDCYYSRGRKMCW